MSDQHVGAEPADEPDGAVAAHRAELEELAVATILTIMGDSHLSADTRLAAVEKALRAVGRDAPPKVSTPNQTLVLSFGGHVQGALRGMRDAIQLMDGASNSAPEPGADR